MSNTAISGRAMLVNLNISQWTARKMDKRATKDVLDKANAANDAGRFNKALVSKQALAEISKIAGSARTEHYTRTLPWNDDGPRILSAVGYLDYTNAMRAYENDFRHAVDRFCENFESFREQAKFMLGEMFDPADYPEPPEVFGRFKFSLRIMPFPDATDFRVDLGQAQVEAIKADLEARANEAITFATREVYQRIADRAAHMVEKLTTYKPGDGENKAEGIFRDSLVGNIEELVELLPSLNITNDPALEKIGKRLKKDLCDYTAEDLRTDDMAREQVAKKAAKILADVSSFL